MALKQTVSANGGWRFFILTDAHSKPFYEALSGTNYNKTRFSIINKGSVEANQNNFIVQAVTAQSSLRKKNKIIHVVLITQSIHPSLIKLLSSSKQRNDNGSVMVFSFIHNHLINQIRDGKVNFSQQNQNLQNFLNSIQPFAKVIGWSSILNASSRIESHSNNSSFICLSCNSSFAKKYSLLQHVSDTGHKPPTSVRVRPERLPAPCIDNKFAVFQSVDKDSNKVKINEFSWLCSMSDCKKGFESLRSLVQHCQATKHECMLFACESCGLVTETYKAATLHRSRAGMQHKVRKRSILNVIVINPPNTTTANQIPNVQSPLSASLSNKMDNKPQNVEESSSSEDEDSEDEDQLDNNDQTQDDDNDDTDNSNSNNNVNEQDIRKIIEALSVAADEYLDKRKKENSSSGIPQPSKGPQNFNSLQEELKDSNCCSFMKTKKQYIPQAWYSCYTCVTAGRLMESEGVCYSCAKVCHSGHNLSAERYSAFYCDCGLKGCSNNKKNDSETDNDKVLSGLKLGTALIAGAALVGAGIAAVVSLANSSNSSEAQIVNKPPVIAQYIDVRIRAAHSNKYLIRLHNSMAKANTRCLAPIVQCALNEKDLTDPMPNSKWKDSIWRLRGIKMDNRSVFSFGVPSQPIVIQSQSNNPNDNEPGSIIPHNAPSTEDLLRMTVDEGSRSNGGHVVMDIKGSTRTGSVGGAAQRFVMTAVNKSNYPGEIIEKEVDYFAIHPHYAREKAWDIKGILKDDGVELLTWDFHMGSNQMFAFHPVSEIQDNINLLYPPLTKTQLMAQLGLM